MTKGVHENLPELSFTIQKEASTGEQKLLLEVQEQQNPSMLPVSTGAVSSEEGSHVSA